MLRVKELMGVEAAVTRDLNHHNRGLAARRCPGRLLSKGRKGVVTGVDSYLRLVVTGSRRLCKPTVIDTLIEPDPPNFVNEAKYFRPFSFWNLNPRMKPSVPRQQPSATEGIHHTPSFFRAPYAFSHRRSVHRKTSLYRSC